MDSVSVIWASLIAVVLSCAWWLASTCGSFYRNPCPVGNADGVGVLDIWFVGLVTLTRLFLLKYSFWTAKVRETALTVVRVSGKSVPLEASVVMASGWAVSSSLWIGAPWWFSAGLSWASPVSVASLPSVKALLVVPPIWLSVCLSLASPVASWASEKPSCAASVDFDPSSGSIYGCWMVSSATSIASPLTVDYAGV